MAYCEIPSPCNLSGTVTCPPSKSYTHRAIFLASLADTSGTRITNVLRSADTDATMRACRQLGASIKYGEGGRSVVVTEPIRARKRPAGEWAGSDDISGAGDGAGGRIEIDAANSGTTIRIAAGVAALLGGRGVTLTGDASLRTRPMQPLLDALSEMGAACSSAADGRPPLEVRGPIHGGEISIRGNVSSQFVTSLFLCAPLTDRGMGITISGGMVSRPYLDATIGAMRKFGIEVQTLVPYKSYRVPPQIVRSPPSFAVPSDASSLALLLAASALNSGNITVDAMLGTLPQGDEAFIEILESMGAAISMSDSRDTGGAEDMRQGGRGGSDDDAAAAAAENRDSDKTVPMQNETIQVGMGEGQGGGMLAGGRFDLSNNPDLLPPLAIMALVCSRPIEIFNVEHARLKETDRISILARELPKLGIAAEERRDGIMVEATGSAGAHVQSEALAGGGRDTATTAATTINAENDHRLFMALCIAGMRVGGCRISDPGSVAVSYPGFIEDVKRLGADITIS